MDEKKIQTILKEVSERIRPESKKLLKDIDSFLAKLNKEIAKSKIDAKAVVGGSMSKDTHLKGDHDCDVFVRFNYSYKGQDLSLMLEKILKPFKPELVHGSRDYYHIKASINYELVPVLEIEDPKMAVNVTDMSPLHTTWVNKHNGMNNEIRLAKQFCKAARVYGAESYIKGFSGHVLDILTIHYGGFIKLLEAAQTWKDKEIIDDEGYYEGKKPLLELNRAKIDSPIIVIDPVLSERNAAAALSYEKLEKFKKKAAEFMAAPSIEFFEIKPVTLADLKKKAGTDLLIAFDVKSQEGKEDVVGAKLMKAFQLIRNQLKFNDFVLKDSDWVWDKKADALFWYIIDPKELFSITKWVGPPTWEKERAQSFREKHRNTFIENSRVCTYVKRRYTKAEDLMQDVLKDPMLIEKVKKITLVDTAAKKGAEKKKTAKKSDGVGKAKK